MRRAFADTSFYLAMFNPDDPVHERALEWAGRISPDTVMTEFVLIEVGNSLSRGDNRRQFVSLVKTLRAESDRVEIVPASADLFERGRDLYARRPPEQTKSRGATKTTPDPAAAPLTVAEAQAALDGV